MKTLHYQTEHILKSLEDNKSFSNYCLCITETNEFTNSADILDLRDENDKRLATQQLEELFDKGYDTIFQVRSGYDEEGGQCIEHYLIKPEHYPHLQNLISSYEGPSFHSFYMKYLLDFPEHTLTVWSGAY